MIKQFYKHIHFRRGSNYFVSFMLSTLIIIACHFKAKASSYASSSVAQVTGNVLPGSLSQQILVVSVVGNSSGFSNWQIASCSFTMSNTNNANVTAAKLWINSSNSFSGATQAGTTVTNPSGTINFTINSGNIGNASRFLFLTFDIASNSPCSGNVVDASVPTNGLVITGNGSGNKTPTNNNPTGDRPIFNAITPTISITSSGNGTCSGNPILFNASVTNGGSTPFYQWQINGVNTGTNQNTFSSSSLSNGNHVTCALTSNAACANPSTVFSNSVTANVFANPKPKITPSDTVLCTGSFFTMVTRDTGSFSGGYPPGTTFDYGFGPTTDSTLFINGNGFYPVTVTLPTGSGSCSATTPNPAINFIDAPIAVLSSDTVPCFGETNANIYAEIFLGTVPFHYKWFYQGNIIRDTISSLAFDTLKYVGTGTYLLVVSDSIAGNQSGLVCASDSSIIEVTGPDLLHISHVKNNVSCLGGNDGVINATVTGGVSPYMYLWSNAMTDEDIGQLPIGVYSLTVTDQHGCMVQHTVTVLTKPDITVPTLNCLPNIFVSPDSLSCDAIVNYMTPVGADNCPWVHTVQTTGLPSGAVFPLGETVNTFVATDTAGNFTTCSFIVTVSETIFPVISCSPNILINTDPGSCNAVVTFPSTFASDNCTLGSVAQISGLASGSLFPLGTTTNMFSVTDGSGNTSTCSFDVTVVDNTSPVILCISDTILSNDPGSNGAYFNYILTYSDNCIPALIQTSGLPSGSLFPIGTTLNSFVVTDPSGNNASCSFSVTVTDNELPVAQCQNINVVLDSSGTIVIDPIVVDGGSYDNSGTVSRTLVPNTFSCSQTGANTVVLTVYDATGNSSVCSATVTVSSSLAVSITPDPALLCAGNTLMLSGNPTGGSGVFSTHHWSGENNSLNDTASETPTFISSVPGVFNLNYSVIDNHGCQANQAVVVSVYTPLSITVSKTNVSCNGGNDGTLTANISGGSGNVSYLWSSGETTASISGKVQGVYVVTVTDVSGCSDSQFDTISQPTGLVLSTSSTNSGCGGLADGTATVVATGGAGDYSYLWNNGQTTSIAVGLSPSTYSVTVSDVNGCIKTETTTVTPLTINLNLSSSIHNGGYNLSCNGGQDGDINLSVLTGLGPFTYLWSNSATTEDISGVTGGSYTVTVSNGICSSTETIQLTEPPLIVISTTTTNVSCFGLANGTGTVQVTGGIGLMSYLWNTVPAKTTSLISNLTPGNYNVVVTDANGCLKNNTISITQPQFISVSAAVTNLKCKGDQDGAINITSNGGTFPYSYQWNTGTTTEDRTGLKAKAYTVTVTDSHGCTKKASINVNEPGTVLQLLTNKTTVRCYGGKTGSAGVTASGGVPPYAYSWNTIPVKTTSSINNLYAGLYTCTVTDANGCIKTASLNITQPPALVLTTSQSNVTTPGGNDGVASVSASGGSPGYSYLWFTFPIKTTATINSLPAGAYFVRVMDTKSCSKASVVLVTEPSAKSGDINQSKSSLVSIFPNPSHGKVVVNLENMFEKEIELKLYDVLGNLVFKDKIAMYSKSKTTSEYDFGRLPKGVYLMQLFTDDGRKTIKVVLD